LHSILKHCFSYRKESFKFKLQKLLFQNINYIYSRVCVDFEGLNVSQKTNMFSRDYKWKWEKCIFNKFTKSLEETFIIKHEEEKREEDSF
jgi:hypothetical protein